MTLTLVWACLIAFAVLAYVLLDGFDLGVGILFAAERREEDRDVMVNSVAPVWDGNETWLILGGGGLFAMFPLAYAVILPALYPAIIAMLLALVFRGVGFEFRFRAATARGRAWWNGPFSPAPRWQPSARAWSSAACCRESASRIASMPAAGGTGSRFHRPVRLRGRRRLRAAGCVLADLAHRRAAPGSLPAARTLAGDRHARVHRCGEPVDPDAQSDVHAALVQLAGHPADQSGADPRRARRMGVLARPVAAASRHAVPLHDRPGSCSAMRAWASACGR